MSGSLNFNNIEKKYFPVTLADGKSTTLLVGTPTKAILDNLIRIQSGLETIQDGETDSGAADDLYDACAQIMSRNKTGVKITKDYLAEVFDFEDIMIFFEAYMGFISEVTGRKN